MHKNIGISALLLGGLFVGLIIGIVFGSMGIFSPKPEMLVTSPIPNQRVSGIVVLRAYAKTQISPDLLSAQLIVDNKDASVLRVVRATQEEIGVIGTWDGTKSPGKHTLAIDLFDLTTGKKTLIRSTSIPVNVLLFNE